MKIVKNQQRTKKLHKFWGIWKKYEDLLFNKCLSYTENYHNAQDLLSEVMQKAYAKKNTHILKSNPGGWLFKILTNLYFDKYRRTFKSGTHLTYTGNPELLDKERFLTSSTPLNKIINDEFHECIQACLEEMPPRRRHIARLYFLGYSYKEICFSYDLQPEAVRQAIQLCRSQIRKAVEHYQADYKNLPEKNDNRLKSKTLHLHLFRYQCLGITHYNYIVNSIPAYRLKQKEQSLCKYIQSHSTSSTRKVILAFNLSSQGKLNEALKILKDLIAEGYFCDEVFTLTIKILFLLNKKPKILELVDLAIKNLPSVPNKFYVWWMMSQKQYKYAEHFLKSNIMQGAPDIESRCLLVQIFEFQDKNMEAYLEGERVYSFSLNNPDIFIYHLKNLLILDGYKTARQFVKEQYRHANLSDLDSFYYLHFLVNEGNNSTRKEFITMFNKVRKKLFWHPDFALIKAIISPDRKVKILQRRCADYPACALSKYYLEIFTGQKTEVSALNYHEKIHLTIIKMIYGR